MTPEIFREKEPAAKEAVKDILKATPTVKRFTNIKHDLAQTCVDTGVKMANLYNLKSNDPAFRQSELGKLFLEKV